MIFRVVYLPSLPHIQVNSRLFENPFLRFQSTAVLAVLHLPVVSELCGGTITPSVTAVCTDKGNFFVVP